MRDDLFILSFILKEDAKKYMLSEKEVKKLLDIILSCFPKE